MSGFNVRNFISGEVVAHFPTELEAHEYADSQHVSVALALIVQPADN